MSAPNPYLGQPVASEDRNDGMPPLLRGAMWVAICALIAAAVLCVIWVLLSPEGDVIPKAFLTIILLAGFAGVALLDAHLASGRAGWVVPASMAAWVVALLCGLTLVWLPNEDYFAPFKVWNFILIVGFLQLVVLHQRLFWRAHKRYVTGFTRTLAIVTTVCVLALLGMALVPLTVMDLIDFPDLYGRIMVALAILSAVGTALIPLITAMFGPKKQRPASGQLPWPTYADGRTPLPMLSNGQPDFAAQQTGVPSPGSQSFGPPPQHTPNPAAAYPNVAPAQPYAPAPQQDPMQQQYRGAQQYPAAQQPYPGDQQQAAQQPAAPQQNPPTQPYSDAQQPFPPVPPEPPRRPAPPQ